MIGRDFYRQKWVLWFAPGNHHGHFAITLFAWCFYSCDPDQVTTRWRQHEDWHKVQFRRVWYVGYPFIYCWYYLVNRIRHRMSHYDAYYNNPLEVEARRAETEPMEWPSWAKRS